jgi:hypothetical protein
MSKFKAVETAKINDKLPSLNIGTYLLEVKAVKHVQGNTGEYFISEFKVLESSGEGASSVGSEVSHLIKLDTKYKDTAYGNVKSFVAALTKENPDNIKGAMVDALVSDKNPAKGERLRATAFNSPTKEGKDFTKVRYSAV